MNNMEIFDKPQLYLPLSVDTVLLLYFGRTQRSRALWQEHSLAPAQLCSNGVWLEKLYSSGFTVFQKSMARTPF